MRIAVFAHEFPALSETFVLNQVTGLLDLGHDVTVFANGPRQEGAVHGDVARYALSRRVRYPGLPDRRLSRMCAGVGHMVRLGAHDPRCLGRSLNVLRYGRLAASGRLLFWGNCLKGDGDGAFDVILAHFGPVGQLAARLRSAGLISGRLATVMHGVDVSACLRDDPDAYRNLFAEGDLFLPISALWRDKLAAAGCPPERMAVHHMGVDTARYAYRPRLHVPGRTLDVLTVGRLVEKKGVTHALRALAGLRARGQSVNYRVVGDGPERGALQALCRDLGLEDSVTFLGWQDQDAVIREMQSADVLLAPSVTTDDGDQEGIPVTLMEAMASGMIVVSTWHSGIPELVEDEVSGMLVPEGDVSALTEALVRLVCDDADRWPAISEAARRRVRADFDIDRLNKTLEARLADLVAAPEATSERLAIAG